MKSLLHNTSLLVLISVFLVSCNEDRNTSKSNSSNLLKEYPNEWMYNQRAYPDNYINSEAIKSAILQSKSIINNRTPQGTDWTLVGPLNTGGRITDVAISPDNDDVLYVSTPVGGIFKTTDRGQNWIPIFDDISKPSVGNIAIAPSNSQRIYLGTGEANGSATSGAFFGDGMYRSDDAGENWTHIGLPESNHIGRIVIDPSNPDRVFVAATGKLYGKNDERGIYRTTNGGNDWERVLFVTDSTAAIDVAINSVNTNIIFAAMWERTREPWQRDYGGETSAIHRSLDGGDTWQKLGVANGLPAPDSQTGRIGIAISNSDPSTIYARYTTDEITNAFNGLYKSTDNGDNWNLVALGDISDVDSSFGWYFGNVRIHPSNPDEVYVMGQQLYKTTNSGTSWNSVTGMHVDHHAMEISKNNNDFILAGNDGGAYISEDGGNTWSHFNNIPNTQFYNIDVDFIQPEHIYGGTQDNNTIRTLTAGTNDWNSVWGGDGFHVAIDPVDNNYIYVESQWGNIGKSSNGGNSFNNATAGLVYDRTNWNTPITISPFNNEIVYFGANKLFSSNRATNWTAISPDLTNGQHSSGSLSYGTLTAIAPSYNNLDVIYTGSDDGNVQVTFDGGTNWQNVSADLPNRYITSIAISPVDDFTAYVTFSGYSVLDYTPHIFKTTNGGATWIDISSNLPSIPVNDVILDTEQNLIFVATDLNVWYSENDGNTWNILGNNLPLTIIRDLKLHKPTNTLYAGTFGRSIHSYDISSIILGTNNNSLTDEEIIIYPNPVKTEIHINHSLQNEGVITMYDIQGKIIKILFEGDFGSQLNMNFSREGIPSGIYFLKFKTETNSITKKLILQ